MALTAEWCVGEFAKLSPQAQADVRAVLKTLGARTGDIAQRRRQIKATKRMRALHAERDWPSWVLYALRGIIGTAWERGVKL
jgi:hypothetical protein